jgi:hypothetical protein
VVVVKEEEEEDIMQVYLLILPMQERIGVVLVDLVQELQLDWLVLSI